MMWMERECRLARCESGRPFGVSRASRLTIGRMQSTFAAVQHPRRGKQLNHFRLIGHPLRKRDQYKA